MPGGSALHLLLHPSFVICLSLVKQSGSVYMFVSYETVCSPSAYTAMLWFRFVLHLPENLPMDAAAPLLCAGITTYSPLMHHGLKKPGMKIGVVGLGGLGHMAVKMGKAMGLEVHASASGRHSLQAVPLRWPSMTRSHASNGIPIIASLPKLS